MSEEIARLIISVEHIEKTLEEIVPKIEKHEVACEVHAPMAKKAHDSSIEGSKFMASIDTKVNNIIKEMDEVSKDRAVFQKNVLEKLDDLACVNNVRDIAEAEKRGAEKAMEKVRDKRDTRLNGIIGTLFIMLIGFGVWVVTQIISLKVDDATHNTHSTKAVKKDNQEDKE